MSEIQALLDQVRTLRPDEIRERLIAMEGEQKALRTLLRVTLQAQKTIPQGATSSKTETRPCK